MSVSPESNIPFPFISLYCCHPTRSYPSLVLCGTEIFDVAPVGSVLSGTAEPLCGSNLYVASSLIRLILILTFSPGIVPVKFPFASIDIESGRFIAGFALASYLYPLIAGMLYFISPPAGVPFE